MKEEIVNTTSTNKNYICEVCNKRYIIKSAAKKCEISHDCTHSNIKYQSQIEVFDREVEIVITKKCSYCDTLLGCRIFSELPRKQKILKSLYEFNEQQKDNI